MENLSPEVIELLEYQRQRTRRRMRWIGIGAAALLTVGIAGGLSYAVFLHSKLASQVPASIRASATFPIYVSAKNTYVASPDSFKYAQGVLIYQINDAGVPLVVSEQVKTTEFNISNFASNSVQTLTDKQQFAIHDKQVLVAKLGGRTLGMMDTGDTIITITGNNQTSIETIKSVLRSLQSI